MIVSTNTSIDYAINLRRLMAREGLTLAELARRSRLHYRTLKDVLAGGHRPRSRTLNRLAAGLKVPIEELFQDPALLRHRLFDRHTNPAVEDVVASHPQLFHGWTAAEFDELYSRFGTGGLLSPDVTLEVVRAMNRRREMLATVTLLLETSEGELLELIIEQLQRRARLWLPRIAKIQKGVAIVAVHGAFGRQFVSKIVNELRNCFGCCILRIPTQNGCRRQVAYFGQRRIGGQRQHGGNDKQRTQKELHRSRFSCGSRSVALTTNKKSPRLDCIQSSGSQRYPGARDSGGNQT